MNEVVAERDVRDCHDLLLGPVVPTRIVERRAGDGRYTQCRPPPDEDCRVVVDVIVPDGVVGRERDAILLQLISLYSIVQ